MRHHRGLVMVSLHMGNWEINALAAHKMGIELAGAYQKIKNPLVDRMIQDMRLPYYPQGLFSKGHEAAKALLKVIRDGHAVALMADLREGRGLAVPFLGGLRLPIPFRRFWRAGAKCRWWRPAPSARVRGFIASRSRLFLCPSPMTKNKIC